MKTSTFCICENKGADQHRSICEADQRLCFRCTEVAVIQKSHHNNSECTFSMFIRCGIMLNTRFEKRNSIDVECLFCFVAF